MFMIWPRFLDASGVEFPDGSQIAMKNRSSQSQLLLTTVAPPACG
jgi:hypothetical protein